MAYKFTYVTVQHSGTRFLERYFTHLGFSAMRYAKRCKLCDDVHGYEKHRPEHNSSGRIVYNWCHYIGELDNNCNLPELSACRDGYPIVSTLRHPHEVAMSFLAREYDLRTCLKMWDNFIKLSTHTPIILFNLECAEENRTAQLLNLVEQIDCYDENTETLTASFVENWKPVGAWNDSTYKDNYLHNGTLPDVFNWDRFNRAVTWYNRQLEKCEY